MSTVFTCFLEKEIFCLNFGNMTNVLRAKLLIIGDSTVGKTSIAQQFLNSGTAFPKNYSMTLGADVLTRIINIPDSNDTVELILIDCSGKTINNDILKKVFPCEFFKSYQIFNIPGL